MREASSHPVRWRRGRYYLTAPAQLCPPPPSRSPATTSQARVTRPAWVLLLWACSPHPEPLARTRAVSAVCGRNLGVTIKYGRTAGRAWATPSRQRSIKPASNAQTASSAPFGAQPLSNVSGQPYPSHCSPCSTSAQRQG